MLGSVGRSETHIFFLAQELDNPAEEHREASSDYFAEVVSQSMIP